MRQQMEEMLAAARAAAEQTRITTAEQLESFRIEYLGKKGKLTEILRGMGALSAEERPAIGQLANDIRAFIESAISDIGARLENERLASALEQERIDVTLPGTRRRLGRKHPLTAVLDELCDIFIGMGFTIAEGPEIEHDYYNFEALNIPEGHPARDTQDSFYINDNVLLRSQTSPVQIRVMERTAPPIRIIAPGRVYRSDAIDATHSPLFHQIEGLVVDKGITMADLKGTLEMFCKRLYGDKTEIRLRPHHFPFTEPSCELDIQCPACEGGNRPSEGGNRPCKVCRGEGWIEILGAGMVHPRVLERCGIDPSVYSGFAFGIGLERTTMRRYDIDDIRLFYENNLRFLKQF